MEERERDTHRRREEEEERDVRTPAQYQPGRIGLQICLNARLPTGREKERRSDEKGRALEIQEQRKAAVEALHRLPFTHSLRNTAGIDKALHRHLQPSLQSPA
ncbi:hypothetical protein MHYP_G00153050 [Metynnis hypsauchen]